MSTSIRTSDSLPILIVMVLLLLTGGLSASPITVDFEGLPDSAILTSEFEGLIFSNALILTSGISLNEFEFPPHSGTNVASDSNGTMVIAFANPVASVSGYFTYLTRLIMTGFDSGNSQVGQALSLFSNNLALSGDPGSSPNELLTLNFAGGISSLTISGDSAGGSFTLDDLDYTSSVPEPSTLVMSFIGLCIIALIRRLTTT